MLTYGLAVNKLTLRRNSGWARRLILEQPLFGNGTGARGFGPGAMGASWETLRRFRPLPGSAIVAARLKPDIHVSNNRSASILAKRPSMSQRRFSIASGIVTR